MNEFQSETAPKIYSLMNIGQRGAGKTVFLAGSYAALRTEPQGTETASQSWWLDCEDSEARENIENILSYVAKTGEYPPSTLKISDFNFTLKQRRPEKVETICQFYWWDVPGESCQIYNPAFLNLIWQGNGGCLFIDASSLVECAGDRAAVDKILQPVRLLIEVAAHNKLPIPFALILTKCDLLRSDSRWQTLKQCLNPFFTWLDSLEINYQAFYSQIPIQQDGEVSSLKAVGSGMPILWLISEIQKVTGCL